MSSFKSSGDIQKKEGGPDSCFGWSILFSDPELPGKESQKYILLFRI